MKEFYYHRALLRHWAFFSFLLFIAAMCLPVHNFVQEVMALTARVVTFVSLVGAAYVYLFPQRLALIEDDGITIDHNAKLKFKDVAKLEKVRVKGICCGRDILRFKLKKGSKYPLTFVQKLSKNSPYGAFSIPLYAMQKDAAAKIEAEIRQHLSVSSKIKGAVKKVFAKAIKSKSAKSTTSKTRVKK